MCCANLKLLVPSMPSKKNDPIIPKKNTGRISIIKEINTYLFFGCSLSRRKLKIFDMFIDFIL
jgi:hypothetical protein